MKRKKRKKKEREEENDPSGPIEDNRSREGKFSRSKNDVINAIMAWYSTIVRYFQDSSNIFAKYSALTMKRLLKTRKTFDKILLYRIFLLSFVKQYRIEYRWYNGVDTRIHLYLYSIMRGIKKEKVVGEYTFEIEQERRKEYLNFTTICIYLFTLQNNRDDLQ